MSLPLFEEDFLAEIRKVPPLQLPQGVMKHKRRMLWKERDGTLTPLPFLKTSHLGYILARAQRSWLRENKAGIWRLSQMSYILREYEYRLTLDNNPLVT